MVPKLRGGVFALASTSTVALGQSSFSIRPGTLDAATGTWVSPVDNPTAYLTLPLTDETESVVREGPVWHDYHFFLEGFQTCVPEDAQCIPVRAGQEEVRSIWPVTSGEWVGPATLTVEQPNAALGTMPTSFEYFKHDYNRQIFPLASGSVRLAPDVIVIPVNVVVAVPAEGIDPVGHGLASSVASPEYYQALFDNQWDVSVFKNTIPGGYHESLLGEMVVPTAPHPSSTETLVRRTTKLTYDMVNPDDVFAQCGVQLRLASVLVREVDDPASIFFASCSGGTQEEFDLTGKYIRIIADATGPGAPPPLYGTFADNAVDILFSPRIEGCDKALGLASASDHLAAIRLTPMLLSASELTLAHELGHLFGLPDMSMSGQLMSKESTFHIGRCDYRDGAQLPVIPYGCEPAATDLYEHCTVVRNGARAVLQGATANYSPFSMEPVDPPTPTWTLDATPTSFDTSQFSEGTASLVVPGGGYRVVHSPWFSTTVLTQVGNHLEVDVRLGEGQPNPYWLGSVDAFLSAPSAGFHNVYLGHIELTGHVPQQWTTVSFILEETIQAMFLGEFHDVQLALAVNTPNDAPAVLLDGLRFGGALVDVSRAPSDTLDVALERLLSFESLDDWSISNDTGAAGDWVTDGQASLSILGSGYVELESRPFNTTHLTGLTAQLSVDLAIPQVPVNPYWKGALQLLVSCPSANVHNAFQGQVDLGPATLGEYNQLVFDLDENVVAAFAVPGNVCSLKFALNAPEDSGVYTFDHATFVP